VSEVRREGRMKCRSFAQRQRKSTRTFSFTGGSTRPPAHFNRYAF
jgi:hypothetical protein